MTNHDDSPETSACVRLSNIHFGWTTDRTLLEIDAFHIAAGRSVFLRGPSGSGKSTLLGLIAGVLTPSEGEIAILDQDITKLSAADRDRVRADHLGVVFQMFNLLPFLSVLDNVLLPCRFSDRRRKTAEADGESLADTGRRLLARLGLNEDDIVHRAVRDLSVGQQQRVAAARALIGGPSLIIADEPTSALDADAKDAFLSLLLEESEAAGAAVLFVSHDSGLADHFDTAMDLRELNSAPAQGGAQ
ncbi:MAG: ABC transporter ATP-binding protein [Pseudomonadota bacterium]